MSKAIITEEYLTDIADAIRGKLGVATEYTPPQMAGAIRSITPISPATLATKAGILVDEISGDSAEIWPDATVPDLLGLAITVEPVQEGSGNPSPNNVRPISGRTGANVYVSPTQSAGDGTTYPILFPAAAGTVYGGTVDAVSGKLTVYQAFVTFDGSERWDAHGGSRYRTGLLDAKVVTGRTLVLSNIGTFSETATSVGTVFLSPVNGVGNIYYYPPSSITTVEEFKAWLSTNNMQIVYPLATPIEYDLTPIQVSTLLGSMNNVWSDAGPVTVRYAADIKHYIDAKIAALPTTMMASSRGGETIVQASELSALALDPADGDPVGGGAGAEASEREA